LEVGEESAQRAGDLPQIFRVVLQMPGFRSLRALPRKVPIFSRLLGGLAGSGGPGLVLRKQADDPFSPPALTRDFELLLDLARSLGSEPPHEKQGD
jgi:hypothetical protein